MPSDVIEETKNQKFRRIAAGRVPRAVEKIGLLENLFSSNYESTPEERQTLVDEVQAAVDNVRAVFELPLTATGPQAAPAPIEADQTAEDESETEQVAEEAETAAPKPAAPKKGEYLSFSKADDLKLMTLGEHIDRAISMLDDGDADQARELLQQIMVS
jgi:hypothetical protein